MNTAQRAICLIKNRQKYLAINSPAFSHLEVVGSSANRGATATLMHDATDGILYVVYSWVPVVVLPDVNDDHHEFNKQLIEQHYGLTLSVGQAVGEYLAQTTVEGNKPTSVVYTGHGWGGALAVMQSFVTPPHYLVTFGQPPVGNHRCTEYMRNKIQAKCFGPFVYDRFTAAGDDLAHPSILGGYRHVGDKVANHIHYDDAGTTVNPSWWHMVKQKWKAVSGQIYTPVTYMLLLTGKQS